MVHYMAGEVAPVRGAGADFVQDHFQGAASDSAAHHPRPHQPRAGPSANLPRPVHRSPAARSQSLIKAPMTVPWKM
nr:hypothetical protein GCM10010200_100510 [Actinomadura rugatobispora]